jgi:hypothetical protein
MMQLDATIMGLNATRCDIIIQGFLKLKNA